MIFFLGNYIAHAATVISGPVQDLTSTMTLVILALLFPTMGIVRGLSAIVNLVIFAKTDLQIAARARALCMVVRSRK